MNKKRSWLTDGKLSVLLIILLLVVDQIIKIWVKTHMSLGESIRVTDWFFIDFIENSGMAYGMTFINKFVLSILRLVAIGFIGWYIRKQVKAQTRTCYILLLSMIWAGAAGNIIDSMFYGLMFDVSTPYSVSSMVPFGTGYAPFLMGKVVDMFYFPLIVSTWPDWVPVVGGTNFIFFSPVFNFADACISVGVVLVLCLCRKEMESISATSAGQGIDKKDNKREDSNR